MRGAVIFGRERDQTGILIDLNTDTYIDVNDTHLASLRNKLWCVQVFSFFSFNHTHQTNRPTIEEANSIAPAHSRIFKEMILFTSEGKPLPLTPKGTLMRKAAIKLYEKEINALWVLI